MLKSQKCSRWEAEGEREETLQKLQVRVADLGHSALRAEGSVPVSRWSQRVNARAAGLISASGRWEQVLACVSAFFHPPCVPQRYDMGHNQQAIANPAFTYSALAPDVSLEQSPGCPESLQLSQACCLAGERGSEAVWLAGGTQAARHRGAKPQMEARSAARSRGGTACLCLPPSCRTGGSAAGLSPLHRRWLSWQSVSERQLPSELQVTGV